MSKRYTPQEAKIKIGRYCASRERSQYEVKEKLYSYGLYTSEVNDVLFDLIAEDFVNEERFAKAYVMDKLRINHWGINKIKLGLQNKKISKPCMNLGFKEIDQEEYNGILKGVLERKNRLIQETNAYKRLAKLMNYGVSRGFEYGLVREIAEEVMSSSNA